MTTIFESDAGVVGCEVPFGYGVNYVSLLEPGGDLVGQVSCLSGKRSCAGEWRAACNAAHNRRRSEESEDAPPHPNHLDAATRWIPSLSVPLFLVDPKGDLLFYNEPAEALLGRRFDETGAMPAEEWSTVFTPVDDEGRPIPAARLPLMIALDKHRPAYQRFFIRGLNGVRRHLEVAAIPIAGIQGDFLGAVALFWELSE